jgi:cell wall-associated NlpC family hydrolase
LLALLFLWPGLSDGFSVAFERELYAIADLHPQYLWGGYQDPKKGLDCSGYIYLARKRAGDPNAKRTTAYRMSLGKDGWDGNTINQIKEADRGDLVFWTWKGSQRKCGHVGAVVLGRKSGLLEAAHASSGRNSVVVVPFRGSLLTDIDIFRRLR